MMRIDLIEMIDQRILHWEWANYPLSPPSPLTFIFLSFANFGE